jgi:hypothetical protein
LHTREPTGDDWLKPSVLTKVPVLHAREHLRPEYIEGSQQLHEIACEFSLQRLLFLPVAR